MANFMKRNGKWQARVSWRDATGKLHQKSKAGFDTKAQAKLYAAKLETELGKGVDVSANPVFADYYEQWYHTYREPHLKAGSKRNYVASVKMVRKYFGNAKIKSIDRMTYQQALNDYGTNHSQESAQHLRSYINACVKTALADGLISRDFTYGVKAVYNTDHKRKVEYLTIAEMHKLIDALAANLTPSSVDEYVILTAIYTGARFAEIIGLTWTDLDFKAKTIAITKAWDYHVNGGFASLKTPSSNRTIRVNSKLLDWLKQLKANHADTVFICDHFKGFLNDRVNATLRDYLAKAGLSKRNFSLHSLRHTHVAYLLNQGVDLYAISKRLGHANMSVTSSVYAYFIDEHRRRSDNQIEAELDKL
jgi:integrase